MAIRTILAALTGPHDHAATLDMAFAVAARFDAHVAAMFARPDPGAAFKGLYHEEGWRAFVHEMETMRALETDAERSAADAREEFERARTKAGAALVEDAKNARGLSAHFGEVTGGNDVLADEGRLADLVVFSRADLGGQPRGYLLFEAALLSAGRPLLVTPTPAPANLGATIAVAWHGNVHAARAVAGAMPFLERARAVHVLTVATDVTASGEGDRLARYLAWHGIDARSVTLRPEGRSVGAALLDRAGELGADLLVMGGYGHSRVREVVLGGITRHVLAHAGLPVLIAH